MANPRRPDHPQAPILACFPALARAKMSRMSERNVEPGLRKDEPVSNRGVTSNLDLVRSIVARWERGDFGSVGWADAQIEFVIADGPQPTSMRGLRATLEHWRGLRSKWKGHRLAGEGHRELDSEHVLVLLRAGTGGDTPGATEPGRTMGRGAVVFSLRAGRVTRLVAYLDRDRALAELGLTPGPSSC